MDRNDYLEQIRQDIYYYTYIHRAPPAKIFISNTLLKSITLDFDAIKFDGSCVETYFGIPVQMYYSSNLEYYLSTSGFKFNE